MPAGVVEIRLKLRPNFIEAVFTVDEEYRVAMVETVTESQTMLHENVGLGESQIQSLYNESYQQTMF